MGIALVLDSSGAVEWSYVANRNAKLVDCLNSCGFRRYAQRGGGISLTRVADQRGAQCLELRKVGQFVRHALLHSRWALCSERGAHRRGRRHSVEVLEILLCIERRHASSA